MSVCSHAFPCILMCSHVFPWVPMYSHAFLNYFMLLPYALIPGNSFHKILKFRRHQSLILQVVGVLGGGGGVPSAKAKHSTQKA